MMFVCFKRENELIYDKNIIAKNATRGERDTRVDKKNRNRNRIKKNNR